MATLATLLDRTTPSLRESCRTWKTGQQTWDELLFVHWGVAPSLVRPFLPAGLEVDVFDARADAGGTGLAYVGLVPFRMHDVRPGPVRVPDFLELNLRTYVHAEGVPGVFFFSLDAESRLAVWGGRAIYGLPYHFARMSSESRQGTTAYRSQRAGANGGAGEATFDARWTVLDGTAHHAESGTLEHFLTERYTLYGHSKRGGLFRVRVHHPPWRLRRARLDRFETSIPRAAGLALGDPIDLVLASPDGVTVETFARERARDPARTA